MVRVRGRNSNNRPSFPIQNSGVRRRSTLRESRIRDNHPLNNTAITLEIVQPESNTPFEISPTSPIAPEIFADYEESEAGEEYIEVIETNHDNGLFLEINIEQPSHQIPIEAYLAWEREAELRPTPNTQDKQTQCPETPLSPNFSLDYSREYSPILYPYPRWYLLPEEDPEQTVNNPFDNINYEDL